MGTPHGPSGPWNPHRNAEVFEPRESDPATKPVECLLYRWFAGHVAQMQADFAKQPTTELRERAVHLWRIVLNTLGPLAAEARGADYGQHFYVLGDQCRQLATYGETPPAIIALVEKQLKAAQPYPRALPSILTGRRRSVLVLVARGCSDGEIANTLSIGRATVNMHVRHCLAYFRSRNRTQMIRRALEEGVINRDEDDDVLILEAKPKKPPPPPPPPKVPPLRQFIGPSRAVGRPVVARED